ncbi:amino acid synthesis family protein [Proteinivorax hydrogeniformans]|uniref:Amino acid synthesis family protein n=1 Tax=Proteinivorax hydrogeniformans TaxID=1826727 RepID=A0AAU8HUI2_9FIRM
MDLKVRKYYTLVEEINKDGVKEVSKVQKRAVAAAVIENPFIDKFQEDLSLLYDWSEKLAPILTKKAKDAAGLTHVESYGKAAIVGGRGELEHAAACLHPKLGKPFRKAIGGGKSIIPSAKKMGFPGTAIDVPIHYKDAAYVRTHFDAIEFRVPDAPRDSEIVLILAITDCGRPHPRIGGLTIEEAKGEDGLR